MSRQARMAISSRKRHSSAQLITCQPRAGAMTVSGGDSWAGNALRMGSLVSGTQGIVLMGLSILCGFSEIPGSCVERSENPRRTLNVNNTSAGRSHLFFDQERQFRSNVLVGKGTQFDIFPVDDFLKRCNPFHGIEVGIFGNRR